MYKFLVQCILQVQYMYLILGGRGSSSESDKKKYTCIYINYTDLTVIRSLTKLIDKLQLMKKKLQVTVDVGKLIYILYNMKWACRSLANYNNYPRKLVNT